MHHFFVDKKDIINDIAYIYGEDVKHIKNVLRLKKADNILISVSDLKEDYITVIEELLNDKIIVKILEKKDKNNELKIKLHLFQALPKSDKMDYIVQKAVELGVDEITPVITKRCVVKVDIKKEEKKINRWQNIAKEAAKQSKRSTIPKINNIVHIDEAYKLMSVCDRAFLPYELCDTNKKFYDDLNNIDNCKTIAIMIGPEGGFDDEEIKHLSSYNIDTISLGNRILRTETAGICILSALMLKIESIR